jgi:hypothetical protein
MEVVIASALLIAAIVPILKALTTAYVTNSVIERRTRSLMLAESELDEIRVRSLYNYDTVFTQTDTALGGSYFYNVVDSSISSNLKRVSVSVGYDLDGDSHLSGGEIEVTLETLLARRN